MTDRRKLLTALLATTILLPASFAMAAERTSETEILHLLDYIDQSNCNFVRNGNEYDAQEARQHIEKKYHYIKSRLSSTAGFIRYAATESSITGRPYEVICNGERQTSAGWLQAELARYRQQQ